MAAYASFSKIQMRLRLRLCATWAQSYTPGSYHFHIHQDITLARQLYSALCPLVTFGLYLRKHFVEEAIISTNQNILLLQLVNAHFDKVL